MKVRSLVAVSIVSVMASIGTVSAMPVGLADNPSLIEKAQVVVQKTVTEVVRRRPAVIVRRPTERPSSSGNPEASLFRDLVFSRKHHAI